MERPKGSLKKFIAREGGLILKRYWPAWWSLHSTVVSGAGEIYAEGGYRSYSLRHSSYIQKGLHWALEKESEELQAKACRFWGSEDVAREMREGNWFSSGIERQLNALISAKEEETASKRREMEAAT